MNVVPLVGANATLVISTGSPPPITVKRLLA
jgi:hypothetical protein